LSIARKQTSCSRVGLRMLTLPWDSRDMVA
jgi:hypothetical protein